MATRDEANERRGTQGPELRVERLLRRFSVARAVMSDATATHSIRSALVERRIIGRTKARDPRPFARCTNS